MQECSDHQAKTCTKCNESKLLDEFPKSSRSKTGYNTRCKICCCSYNNESRKSRPEIYRDTRKKNYQKNIEKMRAEKRAYYKDHKEEKQLYDIEYRRRNKEEIASYKKAWSFKMKDVPVYKIKKNLRRRVHHALMGRNKSDNTFNLIGCSPESFKMHIESLWLEGMSWDNYGPSGWHIDHIKPCHVFDLSDPEQQKECFHYSNQRPLWARDNLTRPRFSKHKHNKDHLLPLYQEVPTWPEQFQGKKRCVP
jgi:hypothetical protein